jgi:hypothetical protein
MIVTLAALLGLGDVPPGFTEHLYSMHEEDYGATRPGLGR